MSLRDTVRKAAGLQVETAGDAAIPSSPLAVTNATAAPDEAVKPAMIKTVEQVVHESAGPNLEDIKVQAATVPAPITPDGDIDLPAIYQAAALPSAPFAAEQMRELMASLPPELPLETKRQTVKITLAALGKNAGATPGSIVADASRKLAALNAYLENLAQQTAAFASAGEMEIAALEAQIAAKRQAMQESHDRLAQLTRMCTEESHHLDEVLEFFSLDVAPSKYSPSDTANQPSSEQPA